MFFWSRNCRSITIHNFLPYFQCFYFYRHFCLFGKNQNKCWRVYLFLFHCRKQMMWLQFRWTKNLQKNHSIESFSCLSNIESRNFIEMFDDILKKRFNNVTNKINRHSIFSISTLKNSHSTHFIVFTSFIFHIMCCLSYFLLLQIYFKNNKEFNRNVTQSTCIISPL